MKEEVGLVCEMLAPTSAIAGMGLGAEVALLTDGRFSELHVEFQ